MVKQSRVVTGSSSSAGRAVVLQADAAKRATPPRSRWKQLGRASGVVAVGLLAALVAPRDAKAVGMFTDGTLTKFPSPQVCTGFSQTGVAATNIDGCYTNWLTIDDIDNDGDMDILFANGGGYYAVGNNNSSTIYLNDGKGTFTDVTPTKFGGAMNRLRQTGVADIDGDGDLDIYQPGGFGYDLDKLWVQTAPGVYEDQTATRMPAGLMSRAASTTFGDIDNDGDMDLINMEWLTPSTTTPSRVLLYTNDGSGHFTLAEAQHDPQFATSTDRFPATIPFAGVAPSTTAGNNSIILNSTPYWGLRAIDVDLADVDGDFDLDLMLMHRNGWSRIFLNDGHGNFSDGTNFKAVPNPDGQTMTVSSNYPAKRGSYEYNQELCDIDEDGDLDVLIDNSGPKPATGALGWNPGGGGSLVSQLLINDGHGKFTDDTLNRMFGEPGSDDNALKCADVNGDGHYDMVVASLQGRSEKLMLNDGTAHFNFVPDAIPYAYPTATQITDSTLGLDMADLNGDGILDLVTGQGEGTPYTNRVYLGGGAAGPDHTPPAFRGIEAPKPVAETPTVIHMAIRDAYTNVTGQMVKNVIATYKVTGGSSKVVPAAFVGGDLFRVVIPAQSAGTKVTVALSMTDRVNLTTTSPDIVFTVPTPPVIIIPTNPYGGAGGESAGGASGLGGGRATAGTGGTAGGDEPSAAGAAGETESEAGATSTGGKGDGSAGKGGGKAGAGTAGGGEEPGAAGETSEPSAGSAGVKGHYETKDDGGCSISAPTPATQGRGAALLGFGLAMLGLVRRRRNSKQ